MGNQLAEKGRRVGPVSAPVGQVEDQWSTLSRSLNLIPVQDTPKPFERSGFTTFGGILLSGLRVKGIWNTRGHIMLPPSVVQGCIEW